MVFIPKVAQNMDVISVGIPVSIKRQVSSVFRGLSPEKSRVRKVIRSGSSAMAFSSIICGWVLWCAL